MKIYAIRHGQTESGKQGIIAYPEETLNSIGKQQAISLRNQLSNIKIDYIYCSPFPRAIETCKLACPNQDNFIIDELLSERDVGFYAGTPFEYLDWDTFWNYNENSQVYNCESMLQVTIRVKEFLNKIIERYNNTDVNILIVTHGGILCALDWLCNGFTVDGNVREDAYDNCKIYTYSFQ